MSIIAKQSTARTVIVGSILDAGERFAAVGERFGGQGVGHRVAGADTRSNCVLSDVKANSPIMDAKSHAVMSEKHSRSAVLGLIRCGGPDTVCGLVVTRTVKSFDGVSGRRPQPHIVQECPEGISPTFADRDASSAVVAVACDLGIMATISDAAPDREFRRATHAVSSVYPAGLFLGEASATRCKSSHKVVPEHFCGSAAVTTTVPVVTTLAPGVALHDYSAEASSGQVYESRIGRDRLAGSHDVALSVRVRCGQGRRVYDHPPARPILPVRCGDRSVICVGDRR